MAKFTNYAPGPRGITLKDGSTIWIDPGKWAEVKKDDIAEPLPDLGQPREAADTSEGDALKERVTELEKQVEALTSENAALTKDKTELTKQVETLTKPAGK